jgi:hypothetical protein
MLKGANSGDLERNLNFSWNDIVFIVSIKKIQNTIRVSNGTMAMAI